MAIAVGADMRGIGNYIGAVDGFITVLQDPRIQGDFLGSMMDKTRKAFYVETLVAAETGAGRVQHVYEWGDERGDVSNIRLYNLTKHGRAGNRYMSYHFLPSMKPVPLTDPYPVTKDGKVRRHVFTMKALVIETKSTVLIKPKRAKALFIPSSASPKGFVFAKQIRINPGGPGATGGFSDWWQQWWETSGQSIVNAETRKAEEIVAATGQKVIRHVAGTRINGVAVGGRFAQADGVSFGYINSKKQTAEMEARNTFERAWDEEEEMDDE